MSNYQLLRILARFGWFDILNETFLAPKAQFRAEVIDEFLIIKDD
jgi:hypothetical protein